MPATQTIRQDDRVTTYKSGDVRHAAECPFCEMTNRVIERAGQLFEVAVCDHYRKIRNKWNNGKELVFTGETEDVMMFNGLCVGQAYKFRGWRVICPYCNHSENLHEGNGYEDIDARRIKCPACLNEFIVNER